MKCIKYLFTTTIIFSSISCIESGRDLLTDHEPRRAMSRWFSYPQFDNLNSVLKWSPEVCARPKNFVETLKTLDFSNKTERAMARSYRDLDVPFKLYNIPDLNIASTKWATAYLSQMLKQDYQVEKSNNKHFLYWTTRGKKVDPTYKPPTEFNSMNFSAWLNVSDEKVHTLSSKISQSDVCRHSRGYYYYLYTNYERVYRDNSFIGKDLSFLCPKTKNFFIPNIRANRGIECRFSMSGIISETHFDAGRNMIAMVKGAKRYILIPPNVCNKLQIETNFNNPSYRQSMLDFANADQIATSDAKNIPAIDTIINAGEVLYVPSFWFHYIVSLEPSIQCNGRFGSPSDSGEQKEMDKCLAEKLDLTSYNNAGASSR